MHSLGGLSEFFTPHYMNKTSEPHLLNLCPNNHVVALVCRHDLTLMLLSRVCVCVSGGWSIAHSITLSKDR